MWETLKYRVIAYRNAVSDEVAQDAYDLVLQDMEEIAQMFDNRKAFPTSTEGQVFQAHVH